MYKAMLCLRYLRTRHIALASIISVMLGVATMIVVNSVMSGFATEMRTRIRGILADVIVETRSLDGVADAETHMALARQAAGDQIEAMTATVEVFGILSFQYPGTNEWIPRPITLIGIVPDGKAKVGPLVDSLDSYNPVIEDEKIVRSALRSRDRSPGWDLTDAAWAYRKEWKERELLYLDQWQDEKGGDAPGDLESPFDNAPAQRPTSPAQAPPFDEPPLEPSDSAAPAPTSLMAGDDSLGNDPFQTPVGGPALSQDGLQEDPAALQSLRLYVGSGLVEYRTEHPETGEVKTVRLVRPGDDVRVSTVKAGKPDAVHRVATVVDVFKSGMSEYDSSLVLCNLNELQELRGMADGAVTSIQIKLKDYSKANEVVERLQTVFPAGFFSVKTWEKKQGPLLAAVEIEKAILNVLLFLIIAVAGFGILAIFFMIVVEKTRDIGILKALGAGSGGVMTIFLSYGLALGIVGSGVGVVLGLLFVKYINEIEAAITWLTGQKVFDETIYYFPTIPTNVSPLMVILVALSAISIAVLASILPARRAARLQPVEALRYE